MKHVTSNRIISSLTNLVPGQERRFVLVWTVILIVLTTAPIIFGYLVTTPGSLFMGYSVFHSADQPQYLSYIRQVSEGAILLENRYTTEPLHRLFFHPWFTVLGFLNGVLGIPVMLLFHGSRILVISLFVPLLYSFMSQWFSTSRQRKFMIVFLTTASGLGWVSLSLLASENPYTISLDFHQIEAVTFMSLYSYPLHASGLFLILLSVFLLRKILDGGSTILLYIAGAITTLLALVHPYDSVIPGTIVPLAIMFGPYRTRKSLRERLLNTMSFASTALWGFLYYGFVLAMDPVILEWANAVPMPTRTLWYYLPGYGLILPLAVAGLIVKKNEWSRTFLLWFWPLVVICLINLPLSFQNRLIHGMQIPLVILAGIALVKLKTAVSTKFPILNRKRITSVVIIYFLVFMAFSNICIIVSDLSDFYDNRFGVYFDKDARNLFEWLENNTARSDVVLCSFPLGNAIPWLSGNRVFLGHEFLTINSYDKERALKHFCFEQTTNDQKSLFLQKNTISLFIQDPLTRSYGKADFEKLSSLDRVFSAGPYVIYKVDTESFPHSD